MKRHTAVLAISVVINMLLAGMLLGDISSRLVTPAFDAQALLAKLPQDKRALYEQVMGPAKARMDAERVQIDTAKNEALHILTSDSFDPSAYLTQIQHLNDMHVQMKRHVAEAIVEVAKQLTSQQRVILAEIISHLPFTMSASTLKKLEVPASGR